MYSLVYTTAIFDPLTYLFLKSLHYWLRSGAAKLYFAFLLDSVEELNARKNLMPRILNSETAYHVSHGG